MSIAHINEIGEQQTVKQHCENVATIAERMGDENGISNLAYLAGLLHDCGKETERFDNYIKEQHDGTSKQRRGEINHSSAGAKYIYDFIQPQNPIQQFTCQLIAYAVAAHHGMFDIITEEGEDCFHKRLNPEKDICYEEAIQKYQSYVRPEELRLRYSNAITEITKINKVIQNYIKPNTPDRNDIRKLCDFALGALQRFLLSIVIDADRIDTNDFMTIKKRENLIATDYLWDEYQKRFNDYIAKLPTDSRIALLRTEISKECFEFSRNPTGTYRLSCPTGGGKTLASFRYALEHAKQYQKKHIIYIAPYRAILEQNCEVIKKALHAEDEILEHHSDVIPEDNEKYQYLTERYSSPIIFTTMVQFLNTLFSKRTQSIRRFHNFANSIIIVDEVQSIPVKCIHIFNQMINFMTNVFGTTFLMCTATQPSLENAKYPMIFTPPKEMIQNLVGKYEAFKRVEVKDDRRIGGYDTVSLRELIMNQAESKKSILVILNTKNAAKQCYEECKRYLEEIGNDDVILYHLSSNMCPQHRMDELEGLRKKLDDEKKIICISTQLIEAGVDVSFRCVVRSFAGLDSIAQAAGRCNRHGEEALGEVVIINCNDENLEKLEDIKEGQLATGFILDQFKQKPELIDSDLLSVKAMNWFYERYYFQRMDEMNYSVKRWNTSIFEMLSNNIKGCSEAKNPTNYFLRQAFETAGSCFEVIDSKTIGILVPYGIGKDMINNLNGNRRELDLTRELKLAQRFTINVYQHVLRKLEEEGAIYELAIGGIYALKEAFYNTCGLQLEGQFESLIF